MFVWGFCIFQIHLSHFNPYGNYLVVFGPKQLVYIATRGLVGTSSSSWFLVMVLQPFSFFFWRCQIQCCGYIIWVRISLFWSIQQSRIVCTFWRNERLRCSGGVQGRAVFLTVLVLMMLPKDAEWWGMSARRCLVTPEECRLSAVLNDVRLYGWVHLACWWRLPHLAAFPFHCSRVQSSLPSFQVVTLESLQVLTLLLDFVTATKQVLTLLLDFVTCMVDETRAEIGVLSGLTSSPPWHASVHLPSDQWAFFGRIVITSAEKCEVLASRIAVGERVGVGSSWMMCWFLTSTNTSGIRMAILDEAGFDLERVEGITLITEHSSVVPHVDHEVTWIS